MLLLSFALFAAPACTLAQPPAETSAAQGRRLYTEHGCYGCHTTGAAGTPIAPDLSRAGLRYSEAELARLLRALAAYLATLR